MKHLSIFQKPTRFALAFALVAATFVVMTVPTGANAAPVDCSRGVNLSFEAPVIASNWTIVPTPGWATTDTGIEIWQSGFNGAVAPSGNQLSELQGNNNAPNWQDIPTLPGDVIEWSFYHRGRANDDTVRIDMGSTSTQTNQGQFTTGTAAFVQYSGTYTVPAAQTTTRFLMQPIDTGSVGNLVDAVAFGLTCDIGISTTFAGATDPDSSGTVTEGDVFSFSYEVTNLGSATLDSIGVTDALGDPVSCIATMLAPTASTTCSMTHAVTQAEIDAGTINSDATAAGTDAAGVTVSAVSEEAVPVTQEPSIGVVKSGVVDQTAVSPSSRPDVGDSINYTFDVTNTGNVTLSSIAIFDSNVASVVCPPDSVLPGQSVACTGSYTVTQGDIDSGSVLNTATAYGDPPSGDPVSAIGTVTTDLTQVTSIDITQSSSATHFDSVGGVIPYEFVVENTGNVALSEIEVSDTNADSGSIVCVPALPASLAPGATAVCSAEHTVVQADLDNGSIANTVNVTGKGTVNGVAVTDISNEVIVDAIQNPDFTVDKSATAEPLGDGTFSIAYTISVTNTGNVTVNDVTVEDNLDAVFGTGGYSIDAVSSPDFSVNPAYDGSTNTGLLSGTNVLSPGATGIIHLEVTTAPTNDAGPYVNLTSASGDGSGHPVEETTTVSTALDVTFDLTINKTVNPSVSPGGDATWNIVVGNNGPSAVFGPIVVTDVLDDQLAFVSATGTGWSCSHAHGTVTCQRGGTLAAGESASLSIVTTVNAEVGDSVQNRASVTAADVVNDSNPDNTSPYAAVMADSLPVTGIDTADFGAIAIASILFGLLLLFVTGRRRPRETR